MPEMGKCFAKAYLDIIGKKIQEINQGKKCKISKT
jgi:hypothetical protein